MAVNSRRKNAEGEWVEEPNFFDIVVFGKQAENCSQYLEKGSPVAIDGRLRSRSWETPEGQKRSKVEVVAESVQFLGKPGGSRSEPIVSEGQQTAPGPSETEDQDIPF